MTVPFQLSPSAVEDLNSIIDYTIERFGEKQAEKYIALLNECAARLAMSNLVRIMPNTTPEVKFVKCQHHYVFGFQKEEQAFYILAILHEKMDLVRHIQMRM
ncbi:MAG: type II toxin-antitoxin system RelE/ParE family toxin [Bacteroidota bacterium]